MQTITQKEYKNIIKRQEKIEAELGVVKEILRQEMDETQIKPAVLKRWGRISRDMDRGKVGNAFNSIHEMKAWLKNI